MPREIEITLDDLPLCARCTGAPLLTARFPHAWQNAEATEVTGIREVALCPQCDRGTPAADGLLVWFAVDEHLDLANAVTFAALTDAWLEETQQRTVDLQRLDLELAQWHEGGL